MEEQKQTQRQVEPLAFSTAPLVEALAEYDRTAPARKEMWDSVESNQDVHAAEKADIDALVKVQDAFYEVTKDRNSRASCAQVGLDFMRRIAATR